MSYKAIVDHYTDDDKSDDESDYSTESSYAAVEEPEWIRKAKEKGAFAIQVDSNEDEEEEKYQVELLESSASEHEQWGSVFGYYKDEWVMLVNDDEYDTFGVDQQECKQTEDMVKVARAGLIKKGWRSPESLSGSSISSIKSNSVHRVDATNGYGNENTDLVKPSNVGPTHVDNRYNRYDSLDGRKRILALLVVVAVLLVIAVLIYLVLSL